MVRESAGTRSVLVLLVGVVAFLASSCSGATTSAPAATDAGATSSAPTIPLTGTQSALLRKLATDGDGAAFARRYFGSVAADGHAGTTGSGTSAGDPTPAAPDDVFVAIGVAANEAIAYVCDGTNGVWFVGDAASDGSMKLRAINGEGSVDVAAHTPSTTPDAAGPAATIVLDGRRMTTSLDPARAGDRLVRVDTQDQSIELVSGVILRENGVKGAATVTVPTAITSQLATGSAPAQLTIKIVPRLPTASSSSSTSTTVVATTTTLSPACQGRIIALQTLIGSLESVRDDYNNRITQLTAQAEMFDRLANATLTPPELIGVHQSYVAQAQAARAQARSLALALADLQLQLANLRAQLVEAQRGIGC